MILFFRLNCFFVYGQILLLIKTHEIQSFDEKPLNENAS